MTKLGLALDDYLRLRRALGFKLINSGRLLADFVGFCDNAGAATITTGVALAWAVRPWGDPGWSAQRLGAVRGFAKWLQAVDPSTEVPPAGLLPGRNRRATPYLYSGSEISSLLAAARGLHPPLRAATYETFFGLLATTGMRVGEAIRLDRSHLSLQDGLLTIYGTKFNKSRQLPLHPSTVAALRAYERRRDELCPRATAPSFFVGTTAGTRLAYSTVAATFSRLVPMAGLGSVRRVAGHVYMICDIALRSGRCWTGTGPGQRSSRSCRCWRPISVTPTRNGPIGTCRRRPNCWLSPLTASKAPWGACYERGRPHSPSLFQRAPHHPASGQHSHRGELPGHLVPAVTLCRGKHW